MKLRCYVESVQVRTGFFLPGGVLPEYPGQPKQHVDEYLVTLLPMTGKLGPGGRCEIRSSVKPDFEPGDVVEVNLEATGAVVSYRHGTYPDGSSWCGMMGGEERPKVLSCDIRGPQGPAGVHSPTGVVGPTGPAGGPNFDSYQMPRGTVEK